MSSHAPIKPELIVYSREPLNAEPPLDRLRASFITPQDAFYVRSHGNVPALSEQSHRLRVGGLVARPLDLGMAELRAGFTQRTVAAVLQCAGNRRSDMRRVRPVSGDPWAGGAIGNATWTGVPLGDVLRAAAADAGDPLHVCFDACDICPGEGQPFRYGVSIPMSKAVSPDVLLAWAMNGEALAPEHGFPLRVVVPGYAGVRSPKWLAGIEVRDRPSDNPMQASDYKLFPPDVTRATAGQAHGITINEMPLNAAICEPACHAQLPPGRTVVRGWAMATARAVARVDVSGDGGRNWQQAELEARAEAPWSWTFWQTELDLAPGERELAVRAWDCAGQTQPSLPDDTWNFKGYLSASWHRVPVLVR